MVPAFSTVTKFGTYQHRKLNRAPAAIDSNNRIFAVAPVPARREKFAAGLVHLQWVEKSCAAARVSNDRRSHCRVGFWTPITFGRSAEKWTTLSAGGAGVPPTGRIKWPEKPVPFFTRLR